MTRIRFIFTVTALVAALAPGVALAQPTPPAPDTAYGNICVSNLTNDTGSDMFWQSESNWPTDSWQTDPKDTMIANQTGGNGGVDNGGFMRGCHDEIVWVLNNGVTFTIQNTDPETGSNSFDCVPSDPSRYYCTLDSSSVIHGPVLLTDWTIHKVS